MKALEKAKLELRKHLLDNKDKVKADLEKLREISKGMDLSSYVERLPASFAIENIEVVTDNSFDYSFSEIAFYISKDQD